jgi:polyisoprenyl-teichoic acid--peptidoglycan teichoic acid transferase
VSRSRSARPSNPRAAAAAFLSFLFPGFGQAFNGQWALASVLAAPILLVIALVVLVVGSGPAGRLSSVLDARVLVALIVLDLALLGWRLVAILQAHARRARLGWRAWPTWLTVGLVVITAAMHAVPAYYAAKAVDTIGSVALEGGGSSLGVHGGRAIHLPAPSFQPELGLGERITVLLVGIDFAPGRENELTDTMLVASLDPDTGRGAMLSIPRDLYGVPLGDGRVFNAKLNSLMTLANEDPATYPLGGPGSLKAAIGALLGIQIHYVAAIDIEGMREVVDAIGGVDIVNERTIDDPRYHDTFDGHRGFYLPAGPHHLDGPTALAFARSRLGAGDSDFTRAARQQQVLAAIAEKLTAGNLLVTLPALLDAVKGNVATDIPADRFDDIAAEVADANLGGVHRAVLTPDDGYVTVSQDPIAGYILVPNFDAIRDLASRLFGVSTARTP